MIGLSHIILCAYIPYFDGSQEFLTCIDAMQVIIDEYCEAVLIKFLGDVNAQLIIGPMLAERRVTTIGITTLAQCWPAGQTDVAQMLAAKVAPT